jgi:hypothetical protein
VPPEKTHIPEVIEPDEKLPPDLIALRKFAMLMDEAIAIPGTSRRIGLDAGLGLIPGVGDAIAGVLSAWIVVGALRHRVPVWVIARMVLNILADVAVGAIPLLGDVFDFVFEENVMNLRLLMRHRDRRRPPRSLGQVGFVAAAIVGVILLFALAARRCRWCAAACRCATT